MKSRVLQTLTPERNSNGKKIIFGCISFICGSVFSLMITDYLKNPILEISSIGLSSPRDESIVIGAFIYNKPINLWSLQIERDPVLNVYAYLSTEYDSGTQRFPVLWEIEDIHYPGIILKEEQENDIYHKDSGSYSKLHILSKNEGDNYYTVIQYPNNHFSDPERLFTLTIIDIEGHKYERDFTVHNYGTSSTDIEIEFEGQKTLQNQLKEISRNLKS